MIDLEVCDGRVELVDYSDDATLTEFRNAIEAARGDDALVTAYCAGCGRCCYYEHLPLFGLDLIEMTDRLGSDSMQPVIKLPAKPSVTERRKAIADSIRQNEFDPVTAALLYEYNVAEPVSYAKSSDGGCVFLRNGLCMNYINRAFTCAFYSCTMGDKLSALQECIVRQGVWHAYHILEWIPADDIGHNPFLGADSYDSVRVKDFDVDLTEALESLFFYF